MMRKLFLLMMLYVSAVCMLQAQKGYAWRKMPRGPSPNVSGVSVSRITGNDLYYLQKVANSYTVVKWDGISHTKYKSFNFTYTGGGAAFTTLDVFKGMLVLGIGYTDSFVLNGMHVPGGCFGLRFDGNNWDTIKSMTFSPLASMVYKGRLFFTSTDQQVHSTGDAATFRLDVTKLKHATTGFGASAEIHICKDELIFSGGQFDSVGTEATSGVLFYDGNNFRTYSYANMKSNEISVLNDSQFVSVSRIGGVDKVLLWKNNAVSQDITSNWLSEGLSQYAQKDSLLFRLVRPTGKVQYYNFITNLWQTSTQLSKYYPNSAMLSDRMNIYFFDSAFNAPVYDMYELSAGFDIKGKLFWDKDASCTYNAGDQLISEAAFTVKDNNGKDFYISTNQQGEFITALPPGTYRPFRFPENMERLPSCADSLLMDTGAMVFYDIPVRPISNLQAGLRVKLTASTGFRARQGFTEWYRLYYENTGVFVDSAFLSIEYNPQKVSFVSSAKLPYDLSFNGVGYKFYNVKWYDHGYIDLSFRVPDTAHTDDMVVWLATFSDLLLNNHHDTIMQRVVGAFDPNDKSCEPSGRIKPGLKKIKYFIRFQNLGTDTAYRVTVVDSINNKLPLTSILVTGRSHPDHYSLRVSNNTLIWEFNDIKLPPKSQDEPGSNGWIAFEMNVKPDVAVGDSITNKAYIYFDYQKPVKTNTASVVISLYGTDVKDVPVKQQARLQAYPNPSSGRFNVLYKGQEASEQLQLFDMTGRSIAIYRLNNEQPFPVDISDQPSGLYLLHGRYSGSSVRIVKE